MNGFPLTVIEQEKKRRIMNNYIELSPSGPIVSMTGQLAMIIFEIDRVARNILKTNSPPFILKIDPRTGEHVCKAMKTGASLQLLLTYPLHQINSFLLIHKLSPMCKLLLEALLDLQQDLPHLVYYGDHGARINVVVNQLRINFKRPVFMRQCFEWDNTVKKNFNQVTSFIKKSLKKFKIVQVCSFEINQCGLNIAGNYSNLQDIHHEVEYERKKALQRFYEKLDKEVYPQQLAGILSTTGYSPDKGLYQKIDLIFWGLESRMPMNINVHDITDCWYKAALPNKTTLHGTCVDSQIYANVSFGALADGDQLGLRVLKAHFLTRIEANFCFQISSRIFKSYTEIYEPELLVSDAVA